jgi:hypothetical protein
MLMGSKLGINGIKVIRILTIGEDGRNVSQFIVNIGQPAATVAS